MSFSNNLLCYKIMKQAIAKIEWETTIKVTSDLTNREQVKWRTNDRERDGVRLTVPNQITEDFDPSANIDNWCRWQSCRK